MFNYTIGNDDPLFTFTLTNLWTDGSKVATITPEGTDGEWVLNVIGIIAAYEDLSSGEIYFDSLGTWEAVVSVSGTDIDTINLQVIE